MIYRPQEALGNVIMTGHIDTITHYDQCRLEDWHGYPEFLFNFSAPLSGGDGDNSHLSLSVISRKSFPNKALT